MALVVTTSKRATLDQMERARAISETFHAPFIEHRDLKEYCEAHESVGVLSVEKAQLKYWSEGETFFWHPSTAKLSLGELDRLKISALPKALRLEEGDQIVDATLGLASDALRMSLLLGKSGRIYGTEENAIMALLTREGLKALSSEETLIGAAAGRIEVTCAHHLSYLKALDSKSVSAVYFDPMFKAPKGSSHSINAFRGLAHHEALSKEALEEATRVAVKAVVVKERYGMGEFERLELPLYFGSRAYGAVGYGAIHL